MALQKSIELDNGIILNYHRIMTITKVTNHATIIEITSYINKEKREQETLGNSANVFTHTSWINVDYDETSTITDWYNYLKTTEMFLDAEDA